MLEVRYTSKFKKDFKLCARRGYNTALLYSIIDTLRIPAPLPEKNKDHTLTGDWSGYQECHVPPDWLLIYRFVGDELQLARTGTHSDLFGK